MAAPSRVGHLRQDHGQAVPLMLAVIVFAAVVLLTLIPLARGAAERAHARTAADAAALAGAAEGEDAAREVAEANGGKLESWDRSGADVWVTVRVGSARAAAKARRG